MSHLSTLNTPSLFNQIRGSHFWTQIAHDVTHQDTTGRYSLGTPQASRGMQQGHSFPLVRRTFADGCGSLWHSSASSSTRSPTTTSRRPPLSPPVSSGAPRRGLQREKKRPGKIHFQMRWKSQKCMQRRQTESLKNLTWSVQTLWV